MKLYSQDTTFEATFDRLDTHGNLRNPSLFSSDNLVFSVFSLSVVWPISPEINKEK